VLFHVDPESSVPIYAQIVERIKWGVVTGALVKDRQLPSVRELAAHLRINPNTVIKAYRELEFEGFVQTRRGQGTFVTGAGHATDQERQRLLQETLGNAAEVALTAGCSVQEAQAMFEQALKQTQARISSPGEGDSGD